MFKRAEAELNRMISPKYLNLMYLMAIALKNIKGRASKLFPIGWETKNKTSQVYMPSATNKSLSD